MPRNRELERRVFSDPEQEQYDKMLVVGTYLGYPPCCVFHYVRARRRGFMPAGLVGPGPWEGTGFIPCMEHARRVRKFGLDDFIEREIVPRRNPSLPVYPNCCEDDVWAYIDRMSHRVLVSKNYSTIEGGGPT